MAEELKVYKGSEVVGQAERGEDGKASVTISGLEANTDYPVGTYTVAFADGDKESDKVGVPAFKTKPVTVTGVSLNKTSTSLEVGATETLTATVAPSTATDKTVTYSSSDATVATVTNAGKVTAVKAGTADITVTTKDGSKTAKCAVTVTAPVEPEPEESTEEPTE